MPRLSAALALSTVAAALLAAVLPRPAGLVESAYAQSLYPSLQAVITTASNAVPVALFDAGLAIAAGLVLWWWGRAALAVWRRRAWRAAVVALWRTVVLAAVAYLWFLAVWGLNYTRVPIDVRLALPVAAASGGEVLALLDTAVAESNRLAVAAHASRAALAAALRSDAEQRAPAAADGADDAVARALAAVDATHGRPRPTVPGRPKPTLLATYFRMAGVDGLTAPLALETLLNPDLTVFERPFTLAHEWAHLSGHASEADASFVAWLVTQTPDADPVTRYSGWLFLVSETSWQVPASERLRALAGLADLPRRDLADIARRMASRVDVVERVGWRVYDSYLRSQGVDDGVRSYSRAVSLIVRARREHEPATMPQ